MGLIAVISLYLCVWHNKEPETIIVFVSVVCVQPVSPGLDSEYRRYERYLDVITLDIVQKHIKNMYLTTGQLTLITLLNSQNS